MSRILIQLFYHTSVFIYISVINYFMLNASKTLYETNHPITQLFLCGLIHFFTCWNQVFQQTYFILSFIRDLLNFSQCKSHIITVEWIDNFRRYLFGPILLPSSFVTVINFWGIYWIVPHLMLNDLVAFYPSILNHAMHTIIVPIAIIEAYITPLEPINRTTGYKLINIVMLAYTVWVYTMGLITDKWPYPFLVVMNLYQHLMFIPTMFFHGNFWFVINNYLINNIWKKFATNNKIKNH